MQIINFDHPLTSDVLEAIGDCPHVEQCIQRVIDVKCQADNDSPFAAQAAAFVDAVGWTASQWQGNPYLVCLPGLASLAACVLAEIHGRAGFFPCIVRRKPVAGAIPMRYALAEVANLTEIRELARSKR